MYIGCTGKLQGKVGFYLEKGYGTMSVKGFEEFSDETRKYVLSSLGSRYTFLLSLIESSMGVNSTVL